jgi:peptide/nickel transport system permease protein
VGDLELQLAEPLASVSAPATRPFGSGFARRHPILGLVGSRLAYGVITLLVVSILVFAATVVLPGNAAIAVLGHSAPHSAISALEHRLGLNEPIYQQYWHWFSGAVHGDFGTSLVNQEPVASYIRPKLLNSAALIVLSILISTTIGLVGGAYAAMRRDGLVDHVTSVVALAASALPEFVVAIFVILLFSVGVFHLFPAVAPVPPGQYIWQYPDELVLPVLTLVIVLVPYVFRMTRAAAIEALESDYVELAHLKGTPALRVMTHHVLPNALAPVIQVIGLNILYVAGGIVLVENVFNFPCVGNALVSAVSDRDIPVIQYLVLALAVAYVLINILTDVAVLAVSPRRRLPR